LIRELASICMPVWLHATASMQLVSKNLTADLKAFSFKQEARGSLVL